MPNKWSYPPANVVTRTAASLPGAFDPIWIALQSASTYPGAELTSWYRDPARNTVVGGAARSQHQLGLALDFWAPNLSELAHHLRTAVRENYPASRPQPRIVVERRPPHVHFQSLPSLSAAARGLFGALYPGQYR